MTDDSWIEIQAAAPALTRTICERYGFLRPRRSAAAGLWAGLSPGRMAASAGPESHDQSAVFASSTAKPSGAKRPGPLVPDYHGGARCRRTLIGRSCRDYLEGPNVLPLMFPHRHPGSPNARNAFLIADSVESEAFLRWLSRHSYRLTAVAEIRDAIFSEGNTSRETLQRPKSTTFGKAAGCPRESYTDRSEYRSHIIST